MKRMLGVGFVAIVLAAALSVTPIRSQNASGNGSLGQHIPADAVRELLRCGHQQRPEQECFARLSEAVTRTQYEQVRQVVGTRAFRT